MRHPLKDAKRDRKFESPHLRHSVCDFGDTSWRSAEIPAYGAELAYLAAPETDEIQAQRQDVPKPQMRGALETNPGQNGAELVPDSATSFTAPNYCSQPDTSTSPCLEKDARALSFLRAAG